MEHIRLLRHGLPIVLLRTRIKSGRGVHHLLGNVSQSFNGPLRKEVLLLLRPLHCQSLSPPPPMPPPVFVRDNARAATPAEMRGLSERSTTSPPEADEADRKCAVRVTSSSPSSTAASRKTALRVHAPLFLANKIDITTHNKLQCPLFVATRWRRDGRQSFVSGSRDCEPVQKMPQ